MRGNRVLYINRESYAATKKVAIFAAYSGGQLNKNSRGANFCAAAFAWAILLANVKSELYVLIFKRCLCGMECRIKNFANFYAAA